MIVYTYTYAAQVYRCVCEVRSSSLLRIFTESQTNILAFSEQTHRSRYLYLWIKENNKSIPHHFRQCRALANLQQSCHGCPPMLWAQKKKRATVIIRHNDYLFSCTLLSWGCTHDLGLLS